MRRASAGAATAAALLGLVQHPGSPVRAAAAFTVTPGTFTAHHLGHKHDTTCSIAYDLYVPSPVPSGATAPAILTTNGFGGSKADQADVGRYFGSRGYVVLSYSGLGFGGSGCSIELDDPDWDGQAASQLIDYLGTLPYVLKDGPDDPRVGMIGGSYGGAIQLATASVTRKLDTIIPEITWNDLAYSLTPNNSDSFVHRDNPPGVPKFEWTSLFFALGVAQPAEHSSTTPVPPSTCPGFDPQVCPSNIESAATTYPTPKTLDLLRHASMVSYGSRVRIPTMLLQGQADTLFNFNDAVSNFLQIRSNGARAKLVLQDWGHSNGSRANNELDFNNLANPGYEGLLIQRWFDHYLKGLAVDTGSDVEYLRDWTYATTGDAATAYAQAPSWPVGTSTTLALSGTTALVSPSGSVATGAAKIVNPGGGVSLSYSETSEFQNTAPLSSLQPMDQAPGFASWSTPALTSDVDVVGIPTMTVRFKSLVPPHTPAGTTGFDPLYQPTFFAKLYDVAPDGTVVLPQRIVSPVRVTAENRPITVTLPGIVHRFPAGHRLELVIASTDQAYLSSRVPNVYTVSTDALHPSTLSLPVVAGGGGLTGAAAAAAATRVGAASAPLSANAPAVAAPAVSTRPLGRAAAGAAASTAVAHPGANVASPAMTPTATPIVRRPWAVGTGVAVALLAGGLGLRRRLRPRRG